LGALGVALAVGASDVPSARAEPDAAPSGAAAPAPDARREKVAVRVGRHTVTVGELEDRLANIPPFQITSLGASRDEIVRAYVDQVVVRDLLLASGAEERGLPKEEPTRYLLARARSSATLRAAHKALPSMAAVPLADVQKYYDENRVRFDSPERVNLWRILCKTRDEAASVLDAAKRDLTVAKYNDLAREHSIDKATNLRGGNLGFVSPDGTSNEAGLKVDPALVTAVKAVKDGELVPEPVAEGSAFAVVWRRATVPPSRRTVEEASAQIRATIYRERIEGIDKKLIEDLRARKVKDVHYDKLSMIDLGAFDAGALKLPRGTPWPVASPGSSPGAPRLSPAPPSSPKK
jgi:peptidyl-prolyl cis-trans isomerase C